VAGGESYFLGDVPKDDSGAYRHIEGVFGAKLRDFNGPIAQVDDLLLNAFHLISEDKGYFFTGEGEKCGEGNAVFDLFDGVNAVSEGMEVADHIGGVCGIFPGDHFFGVEGGFMDFLVGRGGGNSAEPDFFDHKGVGRTENGSRIVAAPDIVEDDGHR